MFFKCKSCGSLHPSPIAFGDKKSFDTASLVGNRFHCPKTGKLDTYDKKDMVLRD
jgi:hypothetical protein